MIWLAWRQQRFPFTAAAILVLVVAAVTAGAHVDTEFVVLTQLLAGYLTVGVCLFWGVPLIAREFEHGTHRLAWTQSVTRNYWLTIRIVVAAAGALVTTAAIIGLIAWALPSTPDSPAITWYYYESHGIVPFARVLFGLALGMILGAATRHTHIAMALSVPILGIIQLGGVRALRENTIFSDWSFWHLQLAESGVYLVVATVLTAITYLLLRTRT